MQPDAIRPALEKIGFDRLGDADYAARGTHLDGLIAADRIRDAARVLREAEFLIEDVTALDAAPELLVIYHLLQVDGGCRVTLRVLADREAPRVPSIQDIYPGANWHERETHDFFGVKFEGHPDLSPLILPEDAGDLRPLRKSADALKSLGDLLPEFAAAKPAEAEDAPAPKAAKKKAPSETEEST